MTRFFVLFLLCACIACEQKTVQVTPTEPALPKGPYGLTKFNAESKGDSNFVFYFQNLKTDPLFEFPYEFVGTGREFLGSPQLLTKTQGLLAAAGYTIRFASAQPWKIVVMDANRLGTERCNAIIEEATNTHLVKVEDYQPGQNGYLSEFHSGPWIIHLPTEETGKVDLSKQNWMVKTHYTGVYVSIIQDPVPNRTNRFRVELQVRGQRMRFVSVDGTLEPGSLGFALVSYGAEMPARDKQNLARVVLQPYVQDLPEPLRANFPDSLFEKLESLSQDAKLYGEVREGSETIK